MMKVASLTLALLLLTGILLSGLPSTTIYASTEDEQGSSDGGGTEGEEESEPEPEREAEPEPEPEVEPEPEPEPQPGDANTCQGGPPGIDGCPPATEEPITSPEPTLPICDGSAKKCVTNDGIVCDIGQGGHECECAEDMSDCPNHPSLPITPPPKRVPLPYCDLQPDDFEGSCFDRKDWDDITKLYPCNDGSQKKDYRDCPDITDPNYKPSPSHDCKDKKWHKWCDDDRKNKVIKIIKNINIIKRISNSGSDGGENENLDISETIVAINYDEGAGINCVFDNDNNGQCETFDVNKDSGKEPLLQIIPFS
jgi:hypothetical protein